MASPDLIGRTGQFSIFKGFSPEELAFVSTLVQEEEYRPGQVIFEQSQSSEAFYLVESGIVREERETTAGQVLLTREAVAGDFLGRWPIFNKEPHQTTARAYGTAKLLTISRANYDILLHTFPILRDRLGRAGIVNRLVAIPLFGCFSEDELFYIADLAKVREYPAGETIFEEGEEADAFYVVDTGQVVEDTKRRTLGTQTWPKYFTAGNFFGRHALEHNARRRATAEAATDVEVFRISAYDFNCLREGTPEFKKSLGRFDMLGYLRQTSLFSRLSDEDLKQLAGFVGLVHYRRDEVIFYQGEVDETFYILYEGEAITHFSDERGRQRPFRSLQAGDTIGEASLFFRGVCDVTLKPTTPSSNWLYLTRTDLELFLEQRPEVRRKLLLPEPVEAREQRKRFSWMDPDEELVFEDRRHWYFLLSRLTLASVLLLVGGIVLLVGLSPGSGLWLRVIGIILLVVAALFGGWRLIDWSNDYYVITDRRAVHQEKLLLIRETRDEAPLGKIQNINVAQLFVGNLLGFGTLLINTAATFAAERVVFDHLTNPRRVQEIIFEQMERARLGRRPVVRRAVREKLEESVGTGLHPMVPRPVIPPGAVRSPQPSRRSIIEWIRELTVRRWFWFERRTEDRITWRKHWIFLLIRTGLPGLASLVLLLILILYLFRAEDKAIEWILLLVGLLLLALGWLWWNWENWGNDQYIVTTDRIIDTEALPLGFRSRRTETTFDRIQNVSFEIPHPIATILNYGTVFIYTAGAEGRLDFQWVRDPSMVQAEIFRRLGTYEEGQRRQQAEEQQAELPTWFDTHREIHHP